MTEQEKILYAKEFIDKLASGINPLNDQPIPENDIANNVRLSRCFFYVSDVLRQVVENGGVTSITNVASKAKKSGKIPFSLSAEKLQEFEFSDTPITISEIAKRLSNLIEDENMKKISYKPLTQGLINIGMICLQEQGNDKSSKVPTGEGINVGIKLVKKNGMYGEYEVVTYSKTAQQFILDNLEAITGV